MDHLTWVARAVILSVALGATGLGGGHAEAADTVTLVTDFGFNGRHAYYYYALEKGYYKDAGIDLTIVRGQGSVDAVKQVAAGNPQGGFAGTSGGGFCPAHHVKPSQLLAGGHAQPPPAAFVFEKYGVPHPERDRGHARS